jgi:hypothetical protein
MNYKLKMRQDKKHSENQLYLVCSKALGISSHLVAW